MTTFTSPIRLAIVGALGARSDAFRFEGWHYKRMLAALDDVLRRVPTAQTLVAGGGPWADHLAVSAFIAGKVPKLEVHLPAAFSISARAYVEAYPRCAGEVANYYHHRFSQICGGSSLAGLAEAHRRSGFRSATYIGFEERAAGISNAADAVVAFTSGTAQAPRWTSAAEMLPEMMNRGVPAWHVSLQDFAISELMHVGAAR